MTTQPVLVSHQLCPYVQRVAIVLAEKGADFERRDIDLSARPDWFLAISPLGKTPVLLTGDHALFESNVICEYLDDTLLPKLHPANALQRARHRAWMEFGSTSLIPCRDPRVFPGEDFAEPPHAGRTHGRFDLCPKLSLLDL
jgi:glutathione S-transferase